MKQLLKLAVLAAGLLSSVSMPGFAQDRDRSQNNIDPSLSAPEPHARIVVLAGCLRRGADAETYSLYAESQLWELKSSSVNLGGHLDQLVMVTAVKTDDPLDTLNVIDLRMDSNNCNGW